MILRITVGTEGAGRRLDDAVAFLSEGISKSEARRIIDRGGCSVNGSMVRVASRQVRNDDVIEVGVMEPGRFRELVLAPESVLYEDEEVLAVNKPAGINTQRTPYQLKGTLEYWVGEHLRLQGLGEPARVIHRLDRGTSGAMVFPKNRKAAAWLSQRFHDGMVEKRYLAATTGVSERDAWSVDAPIGKIGSARYGIVAAGRPAVTEFRRISTAAPYSLVEARPVTGRTHQIRVHLESCGLPIVGDPTYGVEAGPRMLLHCSRLCFTNGAGRKIELVAPLDAPFQDWLLSKGFPAAVTL